VRYAIPDPLTPLTKEFFRVWTLYFRPATKFLEELSSLPRIGSPSFLQAFITGGSTSNFLYPLKLEEYVGRIRVHRWLFPLEGSKDDANYDWLDLERSYVRGNLSRESTLWSYATDQMVCALNLSLKCAPIRQRKPSCHELVLWIDRGVDPPVPQEHILVSIPLDPGLLEAQRDQGILRSESSNSWEQTFGAGDAFRWEWHLRMQEFPT
jgi:hypothetical protein